MKRKEKRTWEERQYDGVRKVKNNSEKLKNLLRGLIFGLAIGVIIIPNLTEFVEKCNTHANLQYEKMKEGLARQGLPKEVTKMNVNLLKGEELIIEQKIDSLPTFVKFRLISKYYTDSDGKCYLVEQTTNKLFAVIVNVGIALILTIMILVILAYILAEILNFIIQRLLIFFIFIFTKIM